MSWKPEVEGIEKRRELAKAHGGAEAVAKQHAMERLTIRERVDALLANLAAARQLLEVVLASDPGMHEASAAYAKLLVEQEDRAAIRPAIASGFRRVSRAKRRTQESNWSR